MSLFSLEEYEVNRVDLDYDARHYLFLGQDHNRICKDLVRDIDIMVHTTSEENFDSEIHEIFHKLFSNVLDVYHIDVYKVIGLSILYYRVMIGWRERSMQVATIFICKV